MRKLFLALAFCFGIGPALADSLVIQTCGTLPLAYKPGSSRLDTVDVNGVKCTSAGGGGGLSVVDSAAWTTSVSPFTPSGGVFNDAATLSSGQQGTFRLTTKRAQIIDVDSVGNQLHNDITAATPAGTNTIGNVKIVDGAGVNLLTIKPASTPPVATDTSGVVALNPNSPGIINDPCANGTRLSAAINVTTAGALTTALVPVSGSTVVYICGFAMTIAPASTADTALFEYGSGTACATSPIALTGTFGNGDITTSVGVTPITYGGGLNTVFKGIASNGLCIVTAGSSVSVQGVLTYVQQ